MAHILDEAQRPVGLNDPLAVFRHHRGGLFFGLIYRVAGCHGE